MKKNYIIIGVLFGLICLLTATALGLGFVHVADFVYELDYDLLDIGSYSGVTKEVAVRNYKAVMDFLSPFKKTEFNLPDLAFSETGAIHFDECRDIFVAVYLLGAVCALIIAAFAIIAKKRGTNGKFLLVSSITTVALPVVLLGFFAINFDAVFVIFHKIFFNNNYWYFDSATDPIINILPETFFMHCAIIIVSFWIIAAAVQYILYRCVARKQIVKEDKQ